MFIYGQALRFIGLWLPCNDGLTNPTTQSLTPPPPSRSGSGQRVEDAFPFLAAFAHPVLASRGGRKLPSMDADSANLRGRAAAAALAYLAKSLSWDAFMDEFGESNDPLVSDVVDLIEHEPQRRGLLGVDEAGWERHHVQLMDAIQALEIE